MLTTPDEPQKHVVISENELLEIPLSTYNCEFCGFSVKTKANLRAHHVKTHRILKTDADLAFFSKRKRQITYIYHCPVIPCKHNIGSGAGFISASRLKQHYQTVHMQRSFKCDRCGDLFATPSHHAYHVRFCGCIFNCPVCSRRYSSKKHLDQHFRRSGHRPLNKLSSRIRHPKCSDALMRNWKNCETDRSTNAVTNFCVTPTNAASSCAPPIQTVVLPLVVLPVALCDSKETEQFPPTTLRNIASNYMTMMPLLLPGNDASVNVLPGLFVNNAPSFAPLQTVNQTSLQSACIASQLCFSSPASRHPETRTCTDSGTQTEVDALSPTNDLGANFVSVKTCTDEDDISSFIGSLFCDAGVEASFPLPEFGIKTYANEGNEPNELSLSEDRNDQVSSSASAPDAMVRESTVPDNLAPRCSCPRYFSFDPVDEEIQTGLVYSFEHTSMQTDVVAKTNVGAATHDVPVTWNDRPLETPPPFGSTLNFSPHLPQPKREKIERQNEPSTIAEDEFTNHPRSGLRAIDKFLRGTSSPSNSRRVDSIHPSTSLLRSIDFGGSHVPSSNSIGLQSCPWSSNREYSSIASQTLSCDWDSWFNSVHTQTSMPSPSLHSFADMCVGVDDRFFDDALDSMDITDPNLHTSH